MNTEDFLSQIEERIARDELKEAIAQLKVVLDNSPKLNEVLLQSARYHDILRQIRQGVVDFGEASATKNQIRLSLLDLLTELKNQQTTPHIQEEFAQAVSIINNKNVVDDSHISAGRDVRIGDTITYQHFHSTSPTQLPKIIGRPPFHPEVFIGREKELEKVHDRLFNDQHLLLLVNGEGGIGKTTLAARYFYGYTETYTHLAWVFAEKSLSDALLSLALPMGVDFPPNLKEDARLDILLDKMRQLSKPCLLVIDNANELAELEKYYLALNQCRNFHVLLTTRIAEFEQAKVYRVEALQEQDAKALFKKYYPKFQQEDEGLLETLLEAIGKNTLVIELLAKNLHRWNRLKRTYRLRDLIDDLQNKGLLQIQTKSIHTVYQASGPSYRKEKPEDIIAAMYNLGELSRPEQVLMAVFAALPAENITYAILETLLPTNTEKDELLLELSQKGWLDFNESENSFKVSPVVQEVIKAENPTFLEDCAELILNLVHQLKGEILHVDNYLHSTLFASLAEFTALVFPKPSYHLALLCERLGSFHSEIGQLDKALANFQTCNSFAKTLCEEEPEDEYNKHELAISYSKLGETHSSLGNLEKALGYFEEETELFEELYAAYPQNVRFKNGLAISYSKLGETHSSLGNLEKALGYFEEETELFEELYAAYPQNVRFKNGLAISYSKLGETHSSLGNLEKALGYFEERSKIGKELYAAYPQNVRFKNGLAISYEKLGETHSSLGNLEKALGYFEEETELFEELYAAYPQNVRFKNGLAISYEKLGSTHSSLGNLEKALGYFEEDIALTKELYAAYPQNVSFKNGLAISYIQLGYYHDHHAKDAAMARPYYEKAAKLLNELVSDFPAYASFQQNLDWVNNKLAE